MTKSKLVCVIGSVVLTPLLLYTVFLGAVVMLALAMRFGWIPEPPLHNHGGILSVVVDTLLGLALLVIAICTCRWLFRKCHQQPDQANEGN